MPGTLEWHEPASWDEHSPDAIWPCPDHGAACRASILPSKVPVRFMRILQGVDQLSDWTTFHERTVLPTTGSSRESEDRH
jgi:hypothetical protein